ncbi:alkaline phosphatase PhoX [Pseudonocardia hispaniensis]|uniref:Alkaline phosphatase PhoX n=1 Tax=Pseudonocardia hispaniensis TaxID=904933 RepID=A0ABW1J6W8_9PSEU
MAGLSRRDFLQRAATAGAGLVLVGSTEMLLTTPASAAPGRGIGYGDLVADPARRLALPPGFSYSIVTEAGVTTLESGEPTPRKHDGTGAFRAGGGRTVLVNNHEIRDPWGTDLPVPHVDGLVYDPGAAGGCTVVEVDRDGKRIKEYVGVAGTSTNCAGGVTPWNTWLTCEEVDALEGKNGYHKDHGYVFEVDPFDRRANLDPQPIKALGRFEHEAAVVDPRTGEIYLTEDASKPNGLLYRWTPPKDYRASKGALRTLAADAGDLAALRATDGAGRHIDDLSRATEIGTVYHARWTPVPDRDARSTPIRRQLGDGDVTRGRKLEGAWWGKRGGASGAYIVTSFSRNESPGAHHDGQIWFYDPRCSTLTLTLRLGVNPDPAVSDVFDGPDNIAVSPYGGVIVAEDGNGLQHLFGVTDGGQTFPIARNEADDVEFTGPVYSPNRKILFANIQDPGTMFAITGPWSNPPVSA